MVSFAQTDTVSGNSTTMLGTYYSDRFVGRHCSSGDIFRQNQFTAAHRNYSFGTYLLVTYPKTGNSIVVRVNDRCPKSNVLDMTKIGVHSLGIRGSAKVNVTKLEPTMGYMLWSQQDTLSMTYEEYCSYGDKCKTRRFSPYPLGPTNSGTVNVDVVLAENNTKSARPARPAKSSNPNKGEADIPRDTIVEEELQPSMPPVDSAAIANRPKGPLYDLEIGTVGSQNAANLELQRLPKQYHSKVSLETNPLTREVTMLLKLADTRSHVVRVQAELIDLYPDSTVISHKQ